MRLVVDDIVCGEGLKGDLVNRDESGGNLCSFNELAWDFLRFAGGELVGISSCRREGVRKAVSDLHHKLAFAFVGGLNVEVGEVSRQLQ